MRRGRRLRNAGLLVATTTGILTDKGAYTQNRVARSEPSAPTASLGLGVMSAGKLASMDAVMRQNALNRIAAFGPPRSFSAGIARHGLVSVGATGTTRYRINPAGALLRNNGHNPTMPAPKSLEYHVDLLSILSTSPRRALRDIVRQPGSPDAASFGYLTFSGIR
jgi:hypothetical protein